MTPSVLAAAALLATAAALLVPAHPRLARRPPRGRPTRVVVVALGLAALVVVVIGGRPAVLVGIALGMLAATTRLRAARQRVSQAAAAAVGVAEFCDAVAAELTAGSPSQRALVAAVAEVPELAPVATAAGLDADVPETLRALARQPGRQDLLVVAAAWQVSLRSGGGLAEPLERAAATLRERRRTARLVGAELAPARSTARLMAALPAVFLVAGSGLGGHPLSFLLATTPGTCCLVLGLALSVGGLAWIEEIAGSVESGPS